MCFGKWAHRQRLQASGQVSALLRVVERVEGEKAALDDQIRLLTTPTPVVRPPQHVLDLATAFRDSMARQRGTLVTLEDIHFVLRVLDTRTMIRVLDYDWQKLLVGARGDMGRYIMAQVFIMTERTVKCSNKKFH